MNTKPARLKRSSATSSYCSARRALFSRMCVRRFDATWIRKQSISSSTSRKVHVFMSSASTSQETRARLTKSSVARSNWSKRTPSTGHCARVPSGIFADSATSPRSKLSSATAPRPTSPSSTSMSSSAPRASSLSASVFRRSTISSATYP